MLLPDLKFDSKDSTSATAHRTIPIRHIANNETESLKGNLTVSDFEERRIISDGRQILLLKLDLPAAGANEGTPYEGEATLLAAFNLEPTPRVLDVVDIKTDRFTGFWEDQPVLELNSQNAAVVVHSSHWNAGESYDDLRLLFLDEERFRTGASIFLLNTQGCGTTVKEKPRFRVLPDQRKYPSIIVRVTVRKEPDTEECGRKTPGFTKYYQGLFYWNRVKGAYESNSRQLSTLDKFNRERL